MSEREALVATLAAISATRMREETWPQVTDFLDRLKTWAYATFRQMVPALRRLHKYARANGLIESENARRRRVWRAKREGRR